MNDIWNKWAKEATEKMKTKAVRGTAVINMFNKIQRFNHEGQAADQNHRQTGCGVETDHELDVEDVNKKAVTWFRLTLFHRDAQTR